MPRLVAERSDVVPVLTEVFREYGFVGASLAVISERTGLQKGSLYNFFPGGKQEMAEAVLKEIAAWFTQHIFNPLKDNSNPEASINNMFHSVETYFHSGKRMCLAGMFATNNTRDQFAQQIQAYFSTWVSLLSQTLVTLGYNLDEAQALSEATIANIQGALVLSRGLNDHMVFTRTLEHAKAKILAAT